MLTTAELQSIAKRVAYKPEWTLAVYDGRYEGQHLRITAYVDNAYKPEERIPLDIHTPIPPQRDLHSFVAFLLWRLLRVESHECREWFRVDGEVVADPHADGADRDL